MHSVRRRMTSLNVPRRTRGFTGDVVAGLGLQSGGALGSTPAGRVEEAASAAFRRAGPIRLEAYFTFKPEATELQLSETDIRSFGFLYDLQIGDTSGPGDRVMPHLRFLNAQDGKHIQKWQFKRRTTPIEPVGTAGKTITHYHLSPDDWEDLPGGEQRLCQLRGRVAMWWGMVRGATHSDNCSAARTRYMREPSTTWRAAAVCWRKLRHRCRGGRWKLRKSRRNRMKAGSRLPAHPLPGSGATVRKS